jgi:hypothetical protein
MARHHSGGIFNYGALTVDNSTFSGNSAPNGAGGGIHNGQLFGQTGTLVISNSTLSPNTAGAGQGGGIFNLMRATAVVQNSIVSDSAGGNCGGRVTSHGYNVSSDRTCHFSNAGDLNNTDPRLGPLRDNGGPTLTMALLPGSPAIDAVIRVAARAARVTRCRPRSGASPAPTQRILAGATSGRMNARATSPACAARISRCRSRPGRPR